MSFRAAVTYSGSCYSGPGQEGPRVRIRFHMRNEDQYRPDNAAPTFLERETCDMAGLVARSSAVVRYGI